MPDRVNQWLSNWTLCNRVPPACRWPSTYPSTSGCMIGYDKGVSVVWIDTYPSRFFTLHIHFFGLNNAGSYNEYHICNGICSKKNTITVIYYWHNINITSGPQQHLLTVALISLSNKIFIICVPLFFFSNSNSPQGWWAATVWNQQNPDVTSCLTHRSLGDVQSISKV